MPAPSVSRRKRKRDGAVTMPLLPPEVDDDEIEVSDEDIQFVQQNKRYAGFLSGIDTKGITKQVLGLKPEWEGDDLEKFYEKKTQASLKKKKGDVVTVDPADVLPVKTLEGKLEYRKPQKDETAEPIAYDKRSEKKIAKSKRKEKKSKQDVQSKTKEKTDKPEKNIKEDGELIPKQKALEELEAFVSEEERRIQMKAKIAELATGLISNPEESVAALKELLNICSDKDDKIAHLALLSSMAAFKDILPGYRIRLPTEKELEVQVSKEVKKIRDYETALLKNYQAYLKRIVKASTVLSDQQVALKCMCGLLEAVPHFNNRDSLLRTIIPFMNNTDSCCRNMACSALRSIFKNEGKHGGEATVESVQLIADYVKENDCNLHPDVLEVFLALTFDENITKSLEETSKDSKDGSGKRYKSKREEKRAVKSDVAADMRKEVEDDFREASNVPDASQRRKFQTITLSAVFETYFRVLKSASLSLTQPDSSQSDHPLLGVCLKGLLRFSHLISMDFLGDLLAVLRSLAEGRLTVEERIHCCIAAFQIMKANMDALTVDLKDFYVQFYKDLLEIRPDRDNDSESIFAEALQIILCDSRQHDMQRVAAFVKRLGAVSLHFGSSTAITALVTIRKLLLRYKQCRNMLENDDGGGGPGGANATVFHLDGSDPDLSGALSSIMWELTLLEKHYNPEVGKMSRQVASMQQNSENFTTVMSPTEAMAAYSTLSGGFRPAVKPPPSKLTKRSFYRSSPAGTTVRIDESETAAAAEVDFRGYFRVVRDINENQMLRKEHLRSKSLLEMYKRYKDASQKNKKKKKRPQKF